jgi:transposase
MTVSERMATFEKRITELEQENKRLHNTIEYLTRKLFGKSSEKTAVLSLGQVSLFEEEESFFDEAESKANPEVGEPDLSKEADNYRKKRFKGQRKELLKDLEHVKKVYRLAEEDRTCDTCGDGLAPVGEEFVRSELEFIQAQVRVIDYYRETMECRTCRKNDNPYMEKSPIPDPVILHSMASPSTIAWVMHQKFVNAIPLYRQEKEWQMLGVSLSRATMSNWILAAARDWLIPLVDLLHQQILQENYLHVDETTVSVMQEEGRKNTTDSYMWVYSTGQYAKHSIRIFEYQPGRGGSYPRKFLKGFEGYLHTDAYAGYNKVPKITRCLCWAHVRRKFVNILPKDTKAPEAAMASQGIAFCNQLFAIEKSLQNDSIDERKEKRLKQEIPILEAFWAWADSLRRQVPPKSVIGEALNYAQNQKDGLMNYLKDGHCSISNNLAENSIRPFTIGRKNWLFSGSPKGAAASAAVYSLIETAKANGLNPYSYLEFLLQDLPGLPFRQYPEILEDYLPWNSQIQTRCKKNKT